MAALAGAWTALVAGFGGMRAGGGRLAFRPQLPPGITRLAFRIRYRDRRLRLTISRDAAKYELLDGKPFAISHHGEQVLLADRPVVLGIPPIPYSIPPRQPEGRAPVPHARRVLAAATADVSAELEEPFSRTDSGASSLADAAPGGAYA
jgi:alpha,alpha-trehalose phosphorylase